MARTLTVDLGAQWHDFVEGLVESGCYKTQNDVVREGLRLLQKQQAASRLKTLRRRIDEGEDSGAPVKWDVDGFLERMQKP